MSLETAKAIVGNRAEWELKRMVKALSQFEILNTPEQNELLAAARIVLSASRNNK